MEEQDIKQFLIDVAKNHYSHGDSFYAYRTVSKRGRANWSFGSSNDYPMQHGDGYNFILPEELVIAIIKTNVCQKESC